MLEPYEVRPRIYALPSFIALGELGLLPINAYLVRGEAPYLVDTGAVADRNSFVAAVETLVDPGDIRFIYLTHADPDHIGALQALLALALRAKLITSFVASMKLDLMGIRVPAERLHILNPGERLDVDSHRLRVAKPPTFDSPETTAVYDTSLGVLFSSDSFGAPLPELVHFANDIPADELREREMSWASFDAPWVHDIDRERFGRTLQLFVKADPVWVLSSHLPPAHRMIQTLCENLSKAPDGKPFVAPNQAQFAQMIHGHAPQPPAP